MKYNPKSLYRVHRVAWGAYKRVWRSGFSPVQGEREIVQGLAEGIINPQVKIGIKTKDSYDGHLQHIPTRIPNKNEIYQRDHTRKSLL